MNCEKEKLLATFRLPLAAFLIACLISLTFDEILEGQESTAPLDADVAAAKAKVPTGFTVTVVASEPAIKQPIGFCQDDRGRLWVAEAYNYPVHGKNSGDRIVILDDSDGDGKHDKRTVFYEGLNYVTGIEYGHGGVWVMSPPSLYFIPDRNGDDIPDEPPQVLLTGFGNHANAHNIANGFGWGPDGWLYGTHGRTNWSMLGKPGSKKENRIRFDGGVYRYHPIEHRWEPYADGTTNPWGIDWNDYGHAFITNCVNPHLFQVIQGAHYEPWRNRASSKYAFQRIDTIADHLHFTGGSFKHDGSKEEDEVGGGHAHCGTMIYLGDSFPAKYRNTLFTNNVHGRRINNDVPRRSGSGYTASHASDLFRSADPWFMGVTIAYGPSGEVFFSDWSDTGECHSTRNTRRKTGRIYRLTYGKTKLPPVDLTTMSNMELVELQLDKNDWKVRHARRLLHEKAIAGDDMKGPHKRLKSMFERETSVPRKLRALWALHLTGGIDDTFLITALSHPSEDIRSWAVTLLCEDREPPAEAMKKFIAIAETGESALVRLSLASALQRLPFSNRWDLATALASRAEDDEDQNLPLMIWYGSEPLVNDDLKRFVELAATADIPRVRLNAARRIAVGKESTVGISLLVNRLAEPMSSDVCIDLMAGILKGIEGKRKLPTPTLWHQAFTELSKHDNATIKSQIIRLSLAFNDHKAIESLKGIAADDQETARHRKQAIEALVNKRVKGFGQNLIQLLGDKAVQDSALRGLAAYNEPQTAVAILSHYADMTPSERLSANTTLTSRIAWADTLLSSIESNRIKPSELNAHSARQVRALGDDDLSRRLASCWGEIRETPKAKRKQIQSLRKRLSKRKHHEADLTNGKRLFTAHCASCHQLFGEGGTIGPDITGSQRGNLEYMLENIVDPNALVAKDYQVEMLETVDGRLITGLIESEDSDTITVQTINERLVFPIEDIEGRKKSDLSIMPEGLLDPLSDQEIRDLLGYLRRAK